MGGDRHAGGLLGSPPAGSVAAGSGREDGWTLMQCHQRPQPTPAALWSFSGGGVIPVGAIFVSSGGAVLECDLGQVASFRWGQSWRRDWAESWPPALADLRSVYFCPGSPGWSRSGRGCARKHFRVSLMLRILWGGGGGGDSSWGTSLLFPLCLAKKSTLFSYTWKKKKECACVDNTTLAKQMALSYLESSGTLCIQHAVWRNWCCLGPSFLPPGLALTFPLLPSSFSAGCVALPALINIKAVIEQRQCTGVWNQKDELPVSAVSYWLLPLLSREERGCNGL